VISPDEMNRNLRTVTIAPMTTQSRRYPTRVEIVHNDKKGWIVIDQIKRSTNKELLKILVG